MLGMTEKFRKATFQGKVGVKLYLSALLLLTGFGTETISAEAGKVSQDKRPNILLIVADDLGVSDLGAFGGEINTPTLDGLAISGLRFTNFTAAPTCSPTRAMLLSGTDHHISGLGNMAEKVASNQRGKPGYEGYLSTRVQSVASILKKAGYMTYITGKWHLGIKASQSPEARGFHRSFVLLQGGAGHFDDTGPKSSKPKSSYREGSSMASWPLGAYSTNYYTDKFLHYLDMDAKEDKPFFAYLAYTAPHWPLQAPRNLIENYRGYYEQGWSVLKEKRIQRMQDLGLLDGDHISVNPPGYRQWKELTIEEQKVAVRKMEVYAAMVESIDQNVARVIEKLQELGKLDNTIVLFMSDNGAEGKQLDSSPDFAKHIEKFDNSYDNIGYPGSFVFSGPGWASASSAVYRSFKGSVAEGGTRVPAFLWRSDLKTNGKVVRQPLHVIDVAPTILEAANIPIPTETYIYQGRQTEPMRGKSFMSLLIYPERQVHEVDTVFATELFGRRSVRIGNWKILWEESPWGKGRWELFKLDEDPGETVDLSSKFPLVVERLDTHWKEYVKEVGVVLPDRMSGY
jgi:arylsulfatase A-like enzyme